MQKPAAEAEESRIKCSSSIGQKLLKNFRIWYASSCSETESTTKGSQAAKGNSRQQANHTISNATSTSALTGSSSRSAAGWVAMLGSTNSSAPARAALTAGCTGKSGEENSSKALTHSSLSAATGSVSLMKTVVAKPANAHSNE